MVKCWDVEQASGVFMDASWKALETPSLNEKQEILYKALFDIRENLPQELWEAVQEEIDMSLQLSDELQAAAAKYKEVFTKDFDMDGWLDRMSKLHGEESDTQTAEYKAKAHLECLEADFKDHTAGGITAMRAALYFKREAKHKLLETFLVDRVHGKLVDIDDLPRNVREFKQKLLDTVVDYLKGLGFRDEQIGNTLLFDKGKYTGILEQGAPLRALIDSRLTLGNTFSAQDLNEAYTSYRKQETGWQDKQKFIEAYNAKVFLSNFDDLTSVLLDKIVAPVGVNAGHIKNATYELKIHKATNMWGEGFGDEVANIADIVSLVTQELIGTSKKYNWKGDAMPDQYLRFDEFNATLTKIKDWVSTQEAKNIVFDSKFFEEAGNKGVQLSSTSQRTLQSIADLKKSQGDDSPVSFAEILAFISDNPQRHLHTIFDILCKTNVLNKLANVNDNDKNLIWSMGKEIFGTWSDVDETGSPVPSRSLFDLHQNSENDRIFEIVTQMADTLFAEKFMQYFEDQEGTLKMRVLQDYEVSRVKNELLYNMRQTHGAYDPIRFNRYVQNYGIKIDYRDAQVGGHGSKVWTVENPDYDSKDPKSVRFLPIKAQFIKKITIPVAGDQLRIECTGENGIAEFIPGQTIFTKDTESIWKNKSFRNFIKDTIGIDFDSNVELASAYEQSFKQIDSNGNASINYNRLVRDISTLCGTVTFNQAFNNIVVPTALSNSARDRNRPNINMLMEVQYVNRAKPRLSMETGVTEMLADNVKDAYLAKLSLAQATIHGLLTAATVKTGEGTSLANQGLSCLRATFAYQLMTQNRNIGSATKKLTFTKNENGFFLDILHNREFKTDAATKTTTKLSAKEIFKLQLLGGFVGAFIKASDSTTNNRAGHAYIAPTVNSDKPNQDLLHIYLNAESPHQHVRYADMTVEQLDKELRYEFGDMYHTIITNINEENTRLAGLFKVPLEGLSDEPVVRYSQLLTAISDHLCNDSTLITLAKNKGGALAEEINKLSEQGYTDSEVINKIFERAKKQEGESYSDRLTREKYEGFKSKLGSLKKSRISGQIHEAVTAYNRTHRRKPIETCEQIHYLYNKNGELVPNDTLIALWGRFKGDSIKNEQLGITDLYPEGHKEASTAKGYFRYEKDLRMAEELLRDEFEVFLYGAKSKEKQEELDYLRTEFPSWVSNSGKMVIARLKIPEKYSINDSFINTIDGSVTTISNVGITNGVKTYQLTTTLDGVEVAKQNVLESDLDGYMANPEMIYTPTDNKPASYENIEDVETFRKYKNDPLLKEQLEIHPILSKLNRIYYLAAQQYTSSVGGAHYVYKGGGANVLEEEASRWLASNKRNVCYGSTVHKYQNKTLNGVPKWYQIAPIEDIKSDIYSIMGDLDSHKPIDGGMYVHPCFPILENNSLGGEAAGLDKKQFGTYYYEKYAAGGIIKTAGFAETNQRMQRSVAYRNLCKNMMYRKWIKEFTDAEGGDIEEYLDITRDYNGNVMNWVRDPNGHFTYYQRETEDGGFKRFRLAKIEAIYQDASGQEAVFEGQVPPGWTPTNKYKIYEYPVKADGQIDADDPAIAAQLSNMEELHPIQRTFGANENGEFLINNNWDFYNNVFGGYHSLSLNENGVLKPSENSIYQMVEAFNRIGYKRDTAHNDSRFGDEKYTTEQIDKIDTQDDVWQPLKYSDICYAPNIGALKSTQMNVNPKEGMYEETYLNAMNIRMAQLGIQLDKEHHADDSEVSMPTQIIQACANKGYTIEHSDRLYNALSSLTELAIEDCMAGIQEMMPGNENKGTLLTKVATIIVDKLIQSQDDNAALEAALSELIKIRNEGKALHPEDVIGKVAWSDAKFYNKVYSDLSSHLTNTAVKMKFPGTLAVICPTEKMEQMYGDRRLNQFANPDQNLAESKAIEIYQEEIRNGVHPKQLIYNLATDGDNVRKKLSLASNLDTQHHYWVEFTYNDGSPVLDENQQPYRESYTLNTPQDYYKLKELLAYGRDAGTLTLGGKEYPHKGLKVSRVYENVTKGRELGAYNARFTASGDSGTYQFNIFDLASVQQLFAYNDFKHTPEQALALLNDKLFIAGQQDYAIDLILRYLDKHKTATANQMAEYAKIHSKPSLEELMKNLPPEHSKEIVEAIFRVCKVLTYKRMQDDLFKISPDYKGPRKIALNCKYKDTPEYYTVNPDSIKTQAYELIMPKVYQSRFGLEEQDQVQEILADKDFFTKRALSKIRNQKVGETCFHYELKNFNGKHVYIWDSRLGTPDPSIFKEKKFYAFKDETGHLVRRNLDGEFMHKLSSAGDKIMQTGNLGYEVIVTDNPAFYLETMEYNLADFSNATIKEENLAQLAESLKDTKSKRARNFLKVITDRSGKLRNFKRLKARNEALKNLNMEPEANEPYEVSDLRREFIQEGRELHSSFDKSLDIIAGRIPAQSQQSFMPQRVVAFDNNDINTAYVSTFQLFLQGSDLDIDAVTLLGSEFDDTGRYVMWSPLADLSSQEHLSASQKLPFPTGKESKLKVSNSQDSFFVTYDDAIRDLFEQETEMVELDGVPHIRKVFDENHHPVLRLKKLTPEGIKLLADFIEQANATGFTIKGKTNSEGEWVANDDAIDEWENIVDLDEGVMQERPNALKELGFKTIEDAKNALDQIRAIVDQHNLYIRTADSKTREQMAKNRCQYEMYQICSIPSNLVELMVGVDVSTDPIKNSKTGAVALSPYNGDDKQTAPGNYFTVMQSFQEGQVGKDCVGIGAVSIKVNSTTQYYADKILWHGSAADKARLILPAVDAWGNRKADGKRFYNLGGVPRYGLMNLYDKNAESIDEVDLVTRDGRKVKISKDNPEELINIIASNDIPDDITPNVAMSLAAMLSVAVDRRFS